MIKILTLKQSKHKTENIWSIQLEDERHDLRYLQLELGETLSKSKWNTTKTKMQAKHHKN